VIVQNFLSAGGSERFSAAMAILNLILRPFTTLVLYRTYVERANAAGTTVPPLFGEYFYYITEYYNLAVCCLMLFFQVCGTNILVALTGVGTQHRSPYEDIGGTVHQTVPTNVPSPSSKVPPPYHA
jgi:hypothetical protein